MPPSPAPGALPAAPGQGPAAKGGPWLVGARRSPGTGGGRGGVLRGLWGDPEVPPALSILPCCGGAELLPRGCCGRRDARG